MSLTDSLSLGAQLLAAAALAACFSAPGWAADWKQVQELKNKYLTLAADHAMEQQKTEAAQEVAIPFPAEPATSGNVKITGQPDGLGLKLEVTAAPYGSGKATEGLRFRLAQPLDVVSRHSGLALDVVATAPESSPEVRLGCRLYGAGGKVAEMWPRVPVLSAWGETAHTIYLDWSFWAYGKESEILDLLKSVEEIELTFGSVQRAPQRGASRAAQRAELRISNLRLVDYLKGSYDPSRQWREFDVQAGKWVPTKDHDLTLQHRCQEVTGIVATFGGEKGVKSAIDALDMAARTQCWDGSFLDGRRGPATVTSGEYTFGFTIYGLLCGYTALEKMKRAELDEKLSLGGPATVTRRAAYQRMFYRGALARTAALPSQYRDDIIGGDTLMTGANRVLGYALAMRMVADVLTDEAKKREVLEKYRATMQQVADAQGKYSGGFPLLGEGNKFDGQGIHYDAGYIRTHMDWLVLGLRRTGDPLIAQMLERYQTVFEACMDTAGTGILPQISERHQGREPTQLILPDATAQLGMKYKLPIIAQWGYNCGLPVWTNWEKRPGNHFSFASHARGYGLGAHISILVDDLEAEPVPRDLGYLFPRQYPIWSTRLYAKDGKLVRTSAMRIEPNGQTTDDFRIEVGEYPVTVGVPVMVKSPAGAVTAVAEKLSGWPKLLPEGAAIEISGDVSASGKLGQTFKFTLRGPTHLVITGPEMTLPPEAGSKRVPFRAELTLTPQEAGQSIELTVLRGAAP